MPESTSRLGLRKPLTGEPDLAGDVYYNMDVIDITGLNPEQFDGLTGGNDTELHSHDSVNHATLADGASRLVPGAPINGVLFDGTQAITITANPNAHTHLASHLTDVNAGLQLRRIFTGMTDPSEAVANPKQGDLYIRIR